MEFKHYSVLLNETIEQLHIRPDGIYVDGTLGGGGHSLEICRHLTTGRLIGIDQDADAIAAATERLKDYADRVTIVRSNYAQMADVLKNLGIEKVDGIILDLGVSSFQLDTPERGFTYRSEDAPLDMRMDKRQRLTARDIVNDYSEAELFRIIRDYGEDRFAKNIAKHIVQARKEKPIETTGELNAIIRGAIPMKVQVTGGAITAHTDDVTSFLCGDACKFRGISGFFSQLDRDIVIALCQCRMEERDIARGSFASRGRIDDDGASCGFCHGYLLKKVWGIQRCHE